MHPNDHRIRVSDLFGLSFPAIAIVIPLFIAKAPRRACDSTKLAVIEFRYQPLHIARVAPASIAADPNTRLRQWPTPATRPRSQPPTTRLGSQHW